MSIIRSAEISAGRVDGLAVEDVACNLCGSRNARVLYPSTLTNLAPHPSHFRCTTATYGMHPTIVKCQTCGLIYANPRLDAHAVDDNYSRVDDPLYIEEREGRVLTFRRNLRPLQELIARNTLARAQEHNAPDATSPLRLLDVGCHIGVMLEIAQERGWDAVGIEPSAWAAARAAERGLNVINATLANAHLPANSFDAVTMWDVVEHLTNPSADLNQVYRVLKPGGVVAVHTIDIESPLARVMGPRWPWLMEMHLYYFDRETIARLLHEVGFVDVSVADYTHYVSSRYLLSKVESLAGPLAPVVRTAGRVVPDGWRVPVNLGDNMLVRAVRPR